MQEVMNYASFEAARQAHPLPDEPHAPCSVSLRMYAIQSSFSPSPRPIRFHCVMTCRHEPLSIIWITSHSCLSCIRNPPACDTRCSASRHGYSQARHTSHSPSQNLQNIAGYWDDPRAASSTPGNTQSSRVRYSRSMTTPRVDSGQLSHTH